MNNTRSSLTAPINGLPPEDVLFGRSEAMLGVRQRVEKVAGANIPVLIRGESGTGKELVAKLVHLRSPWSEGPFVKVSCPAIPGSLLESELFGYEKGAFTGAYTAKPGRVELANRGTLFMDEIAELDGPLQAKLLQVMQDGQFCRIGAQEDKRVEARIVCSTSHQLEDEIENGAFRQDLFYRINVVSMQMVPLRERRGDIPALVDYFIQTCNRDYNRQARPLSSSMLGTLQRYHWPGNIRELENVMRRYVILGSEEVIGTDLVEREEPESQPEIPLDGPISLKKLTRSAVRELEKKVILHVLEANNWNRKQAARALNISYRALLSKIRQAGLPPKRPRRQAHSAESRTPSES